jgi:hypothetical protein
MEEALSRFLFLKERRVACRVQSALAEQIAIRLASGGGQVVDGGLVPLCMGRESSSQGIYHRSGMHRMDGSRFAESSG